MYSDPDDSSYQEIYSEIELFLKNDSIDNMDISLHNDEFNFISVKLPPSENFDIEELYNYIDEKNQSRCYVITTLLPYLDTPELKKYYIPHSRLNEFLYYINSPDYEENIISITQAEEE